MLDRVGQYVWATGDTTWGQAIGARLDELGWDLAVVEIGTTGTVGGLLADVPRLRLVESSAADEGAPTAADGHVDPDQDADLTTAAGRLRQRAGTEVAMAVRARPRGDDMAVSIAVITPRDSRQVRRAVFLSGTMGRSRAALAAAAVLLESLPRDGEAGSSDPGPPS